MTEFAHERLDVYQLYLELAGMCAELVSNSEGSYAVFDQLDRAVESVGVNLMRANTRSLGSPQRASYLDVSIASVHECAASLDVCCAKAVVGVSERDSGMGMLWRIRGMLLGMKKASVDRVQEDSPSYGAPMFPFSRLDMYRLSLEVVAWVQDLTDETSLTARTRRKIDISTTGVVLNIAEGHGRGSSVDQNRLMKVALEHAYQTVLLLDLMVAKNQVSKGRVEEGKSLQARVISMIYAWCDANER